MKLLRLFACILGLFAAPVLAAPPPDTPLHGIHVQRLLDYTAAEPFLDQAQLHRDWTNADKTPAKVGADGWPLGDSAGQLTSMVPVLPGTRSYTIIKRGDIKALSIRNVPVKFDGDRGTVTLTGPVDFTAQAKLTPAGTGPVSFSMVETALLPRYEAGETFRPDYVYWLKPFGMIRFKSWGDSDNAFPGLAARHAKEAAQLANLLGADMWWNFHRDMTDAQITDEIRTINSTLSYKRKLVLEWSNESWGGISNNYNYVKARGNPDEVYGLRSGQAARVVAKVTGRARWALNGQFVNPARFAKVMKGWDQSGASRGLIRAWTIAPYIGIGSKEEMQSTWKGFSDRNDVAGALAFLEQRRKDRAPYFAQNKKLADSIGAELWAYEYNTSLYTQAPFIKDADRAAVTEFSGRVLYSKEAAEIVRRMIHDGTAAGVSHWSFYDLAGTGSQYGFWGAIPNTAVNEPFPVMDMLVREIGLNRVAKERGAFPH
ncbi:hypothetical protein [uncultured Sphingomonas sp.]|uniref:hypothetical protein n=1 Tax=uncultured Sphingomonas sp. TaxID=158754 RepID=UPI0025E2E3E0|nr:hypothetical protein [uncultured Sphingomonas sp.]